MVQAEDVRRLYLQAVMSRRMLSEAAAKELWKKCSKAVQSLDNAIEVEYGEDNESWNGWINGINTALLPLSLEFGHAHDEHSGTHVYAIINRKGNDAIAQMGTEYSASEIKFFKAVVEQIMLAPNESYCVSSLVALRESTFIQPAITKTHAEKVLTSLVSRGWLFRSKKGRYSLSTRTLLELQNYLKNTYTEVEIVDCTICLEAVTSGFACPGQNCQVRMHTQCYAVYRRRSGVCPTCTLPWDADPQATGAKMRKIGEGAFKDGQEKLSRRQRAGASANGTQQEDDEEDDDAQFEGDDEVEMEEPEQSQPKASQRGNGRGTRSGRGKKKAVVDDDEEEMDVDDQQEEAEEETPTRTQPKRKSRR